MTTPRWDETWHRLREWTSGQGPSERLAAQILLAEGFSVLDPSHPLGGKDGGKDAVCMRGGEKWVMGVHFPRGQETFTELREKFLQDLSGAKRNGARGFAFVTNQELRLAERRELTASAEGMQVEVYHLERLTALLDKSELAATRKQFLGIDYLDETGQQLVELRDQVLAAQRRIEGLQTGGDTFCYFMLYHFDMDLSIAQQIAVIRKGEFPLYDLRIRILDMDTSRTVVEQPWGELNAPAAFVTHRWALGPNLYYRVFFHARNGTWHQDLVLRRSDKASCWLAVTRVVARNGRDVIFEHRDNEFEQEFEPPTWRS